MIYDAYEISSATRIPGILNLVHQLHLNSASTHQKQLGCRLTASHTGTDLSQFSDLSVFLHPGLKSGWNFFWTGIFKESWCVAGRSTASLQQTFPQTHTHALVDIGLTQGLTHPSFLPSNYRKCIQPIRVEALIQSEYYFRTGNRVNTRASWQEKDFRFSVGSSHTPALSSLSCNLSAAAARRSKWRIEREAVRDLVPGFIQCLFQLPGQFF